MPQLAALMPATTLGQAAVGGMLAGTAIQAVGQAQAMDTAARTADYNARVAGMEERQSRIAGSFEAGQLAREGRSFAATQRSIQGTSGLDMDRGALAEVRRASAETNRMDQLAMIYNAEVGALRAKSAGDLQRASAKATRRARPLALGATLLQGGSYAALAAHGMR